MKVRTVRNEIVERLNCIKINGEFYEKNKDCFKFDDKWYRYNNPNVFFDNEKKEYVLGKRGLIKGYISNDEEGLYTQNLSKNSYLLRNGIINNVMNFVDFCKPGFTYNQSNHAFEERVRSNNRFDSVNKCVNWVYNYPRDYSSGRLLNTILDKSKSHYTPCIDFKNDNYKNIESLSYGIEFETSKGTIPECMCNTYGLIPLRDGSIAGHEYATVPLRGKTDLLKLQDQIDILKAFCEINNDCSLHVHVGSFNFNENIILAIYRLGCMIEDDIVKLFPYNIFNTSAYKSHGKDYCSRLQKWNFYNNPKRDFKVLYESILSGNEYEGSLLNPHPKDRDGGHKWNIDNRYRWLNVLNLCFGKIKTLEFRIHNATLNHSKINNWLFIVNAFVRFAIKNADKINSGKKFSLENIISIYPESIKSFLISYIKVRNKQLDKDYKESDDPNGELDVKYDNVRKYPNIMEFDIQ